MKKINAFTIIELVMSLLISSIVIAIVYYTYLFFNKQYDRYRNRSSELNEFLLLKKTIQWDMNRAEIITDSTGILDMKFGTIQRHMLYITDTNFVVRKSENTADTFRIRNDGFDFFYLNDRINLIHQIKFKAGILGTSQGFIFKKKYSAEQLMKAEQYLNE